MLKGVGITCLTIIISWLVSHRIVPKNWGELILKGIVVSIVSLVITIIFYHRVLEVKLLMRKVKSILKEIRNKS